MKKAYGSIRVYLPIFVVLIVTVGLGFTWAAERGDNSSGYDGTEESPLYRLTLDEANEEFASQEKDEEGLSHFLEQEYEYATAEGEQDPPGTLDATRKPKLTKCPVITTVCPPPGGKRTTVCPIKPTKCPVVPTICPRNKQTTKCPKDATTCPVISTICPKKEKNTKCPVDHTKCPVVRTVCPDTTKRGMRPTECPLGPTKCPIIPTVCPEEEDPTHCPIDETTCPVIPTFCPDEPTTCPEEPTSCPEEPTICPQCLKGSGGERSDKRGSGKLLRLTPGEGIPTVFALAQNTPNPFSKETTIHYQLPKTSQVTLKIIDAAGRVVRTLVDGSKKSGYYSVNWDGRNEKGELLPNGGYLYLIQTGEFGEFSEVKKMILLDRKQR